jgi:hypothetical protein
MRWLKAREFKNSESIEKLLNAFEMGSTSESSPKLVVRCVLSTPLKL